jgi:hypothetical protein
MVNEGLLLLTKQDIGQAIIWEPYLKIMLLSFLGIYIHICTVLETVYMNNVNPNSKKPVHVAIRAVWKPYVTVLAAFL